jgi:hypothetical protein
MSQSAAIREFLRSELKDGKRLPRVVILATLRGYGITSASLVEQAATNIGVVKEGGEWSLPNYPSAPTDEFTTRYGSPKLDEAKAVLAEILANGPVKSYTLMNALIAEGYTESTINRARRALGVQSTQIEGTWYLALSDNDDDDW